MPGLPLPVAVARGISLSQVRTDYGLGVENGIVQVRNLWSQNLGDCRDHFRGNAQAVGLMVSGDMVGDKPEEWSECFGCAADSGSGQLRDRVDMAS